MGSVKLAGTGEVVAAARSHGPAAIVRSAVHAVIHATRELLIIFALTVLCALGMLAFVISLGRRPLQSA